jgi:hypothetical protein
MAVKSGCTKYTRATVDMYFPEGNVCCELCPILETYARKQCRRTGEYLIDTRGRGMYCPLAVEGEEEAWKNSDC